MSHDRTVSRDRPAVDLSLLLVRVIVGVIFFLHGAQKVFGWYDGPGLQKTVEMFEKMGTPAAVGYLVAIGECFGGLGLIVGFLSRFSAAANIVIMLGAIAMVHGEHGFFLQNKGYEYNLALIGLLLPVLIAGPGHYAIGRFLPLPKSARTGRPVIFLE
jgi:putative oxidoreductase